ncbi:MAG TPA: hypothetical protein VHP37_32170 [Burkholderiales bacterium]|nr:hypothetical protein [Burkholderiales bacterium]
MFNRRQFLQAGAVGLGGILLGGVAWSKPDQIIRTILPSVTSDTIALKVLLDAPPKGAPVLTIDGRSVHGERTDPDGFAWSFVQRGLKEGTPHRLMLTDEAGATLREPWTLSTLPPVGSTPDHYRILFFTCAGGDEADQDKFIAMATRRALLDRALSFQPDLAVANGDHVYWDQWTGLKYTRNADRLARQAELYHRIAWLDEDQNFDSVANRRSLNTIVGRQIAALYEDRFASVPLIFISDDHDYFENDNAGPWGYTFPPRPFILGLQRRSAAMAYPVALGHPTLSGPLANETIETVRIGNLLEMALFDCRRGWSTGSDAHVLFPEVERFLIERLQQSSARHYIHVPSNPFGWSKGALGEWYEDRPRGESTRGNDKKYWQAGWFAQHQRLVKALTDQRGRAAISISGDLHATAAARITRSGDIDLSANPIEAILCGTVGTGKTGFAGYARGNIGWYPEKITATTRKSIEERDGFTLFDVYPDRIDVRQFLWRDPEPLDAIASLQPASTFTINRPT